MSKRVWALLLAVVFTAYIIAPPQSMAAGTGPEEAAGTYEYNAPSETGSGGGDSETGDPEAGDLEAGDPDAGDPEAGDPEAGDPEAGDPEAGDPESGDPEAGDPEAGDPEAGDPEAGDPEAGDPEAGDPGAGEGEGVHILSFGSLSPLEVETGTPWEALPLPGSLSYTHSQEGSGSADILGWDCDPVYDPEAPGSYTLTPQADLELPLGEGVELPTLGLTVSAPTAKPSGYFSFVLQLEEATQQAASSLDPEARVLYDILTGLEPGDPDSHSAAFGGMDLTLDLPGGFDPANPEERVLQRVKELVAQRVAQPAYNALLTEEETSWLGREMELTLYYTAQDGLLAVERIEFAFTGQIMTMGFGILSTDVSLAHPAYDPMIHQIDTLQDAVNFVNANPVSDAANAVITVYTSGLSATVPIGNVTIQGAGAGIAIDLGKTSDAQAANNGTLVLKDIAVNFRPMQTNLDTLSLDGATVQILSGALVRVYILNLVGDSALEVEKNDIGYTSVPKLTFRGTTSLNGPGKLTVSAVNGTLVNLPLVQLNDPTPPNWDLFSMTENGIPLRMALLSGNIYVAVPTMLRLEWGSNSVEHFDGATAYADAVTYIGANSVSGGTLYFLQDNISVSDASVLPHPITLRSWADNAFTAAGDLKLGANAVLEQLAVSGDVNAQGNTLTLNKDAQVTGGASGGSGSSLVVKGGSGTGSVSGFATAQVEAAFSTGAISGIGELKLEENGALTASSITFAGNMTVNKGAGATVSGAVDLGTGSLTLTEGGTVDVGAIEAASITLERGGTVASDGDIITSGNLVLTNGGSVSAIGNLNVTGDISAGTGSVSGGTLSGDNVTVSSGKLSAGGALSATDLTMTANGEITAGTIAATGDITLENGGKATASGGISADKLEETGGEITAASLSVATLNLKGGSITASGNIAATGDIALKSDALLKSTGGSGVISAANLDTAGGTVESANRVTVSGLLTLGSGTVKALRVSTQTLSTAGGTVAFAGATYAAGDQLLSITQAGGLTGKNITLRLPVGSIATYSVIGTPGDLALPESVVVLTNANPTLADFVWQYTVSAQAHQLVPVAASVYLGDVLQEKYTTLRGALDKANGLSSASIYLHSDQTLSGSLPTSASTLVGHKKGVAGSHTLTVPGGVAVTADTGFYSITLARSGGNTSFLPVNGGKTLTFEGVSLNDSAAKLGGTAGSFVGKNSTLTVADLQFGSISLSGGNTALGQLVAGSAFVADNTALNITSDSGSVVPLVLPDTGLSISGLSMTYSGSTPPSPGQELIQYPKGKKDSILAATAGNLTLGGAYGSYSLAFKAGSGVDYLALARKVDNVTLAVNSASVVYGSDVKLTAALFYPGNEPVGDRAGETVSFNVGGSLFTAVINGAGTAQLTLTRGDDSAQNTQNHYLATGNYAPTATYADPITGGTASSGGGQGAFAVTPKSLTVQTKAHGAGSRVYDNTTALGISGVSLNTLLVYNASQVVPGDEALMGALSGNAAFTSKGVGAAKEVTVSGLALSGGQRAGNYTLYFGGNPVSGDIAFGTNLSVTQKELVLSGGTVTKTYDRGTGLGGGTFQYTFATAPYGEDQITLTLTGGSFAGSSAGSHAFAATPANVAISSGANPDASGNYVIRSLPGFSGLINPKTISAIAPTAAAGITKVYDGTTTIDTSGWTAADWARISANPTGALAGDTVKFTVSGLRYQDADAGAGKNLVASFALDTTDALTRNYVLDPSVVTNNVVFGSGAVTKARYGDVVRYAGASNSAPNAYPLGEIWDQLTAPQEPGAGTAYSVTAPPSEINGSIAFDPLAGTMSFDLHSSVAKNSTFAVAVEVDSNNYEPFTATIHFTVYGNETWVDDPAELGLGALAVASRNYNGQPFVPTAPGITITGDKIENIAYNGTGGAVTLDVQLSYYQGSVKLTGAPTDAGDYTLFWEIVDLSDTYAGRGKVGDFSIRKVPLTVTIHNRSVRLGDAIAWGDAALFGGSGLAGSDTLAGVLAGSLPLDVVDSATGLAPNANRSGSKTLRFDGSALTHQNYDISLSGTASLTVGEPNKQTSPILDPSLWYNAVPTLGSAATLEGKSYPYMAVSQTGEPTGAFAASLGGGDLPAQNGTNAFDLYFSDSTLGTAMSKPLAVSYKLDMELPTIAVSFSQIDDTRGEIRVTVQEEISGIDTLTLLVDGVAVSGSDLQLIKSDGATGEYVYAYQVTRSDVAAATDYQAQVADKAGNSATSAILSAGGIEFKEIDAVTLTINGVPVTNQVYEVFSTDTVVLEADIVYSGGGTAPVAGSDFDFYWESSNPAVATPGILSQPGDARAQPEFQGAGTVRLTVTALGKSTTVEFEVTGVLKPTDPSNPTVPGFDPIPGHSDYFILVTALDDPSQLIQNLRSSKDKGVKAFLKGQNWVVNSQYLDVSVVQKVGNSYVKVNYDKPVTVYLPLPEGTAFGTHSYLFMHHSGSNMAAVGMRPVSGGFRFTSTLSPFSLTYRAGNFNWDKYIPDGSGSGSGWFNGGGGGGAGGGGGVKIQGPNTPAFNDFWNKVAQGILAAKPGDVVQADVPNYIDQCPTDILRLLDGKDITLVIRWTGDDIVIHGLHVIKPFEKAFYYYLWELAELYKNRTVPQAVPPLDVSNPAMGGDMLVYTPGGEITLQLPSVDPEIVAELQEAGIDFSAILTPPAGAAVVQMVMPISVSVFDEISGKLDGVQFSVNLWLLCVLFYFAFVAVLLLLRFLRKPVLLNSPDGQYQAVPEEWLPESDEPLAPAPAEMIPAEPAPAPVPTPAPVYPPVEAEMVEAPRPAPVPKSAPRPAKEPEARKRDGLEHRRVVEDLRQLEQMRQAGELTAAEYEDRKRKLILFS